MFACAWCAKEVPEDAPFCAVGARARDPELLRHREGSVLELTLLVSGRAVSALVAEEGSQAHRDGFSLVIVACDAACGNLLARALQDELDLFEAVRVANLGPG